jgi:hypothetical protein
MTKIVNLFAGPGAGKSTTAAGLFYNLKMDGFKVELVLEYAKDLVWEERLQTIQNQPYLFGKQYNRLFRLLGKVDIIITDSPILLCCLYAGSSYPESFKQAVLDIFNTMDNLNYLLMGTKVYDPLGRLQTEKEAREIDKNVTHLLNTSNIPYQCILGNQDGLQVLTTHIQDNLEC